MFLLNLGYRWSHLEDVQGAVLLPSGNSCERLARTGSPELQTILFDPQLYLSGLGANDCAGVCARLAGYPWFGITGMPEFDSATMKRRDWDRQMEAAVPKLWRGAPPEDIAAAARSAVEFQSSLSCTHIILPAPLATEREDEAETLGQWLDEGLTAAADLEIAQPVLATVAWAESVLNDSVFAEAGFLDAVVDQVISREGLGGVYIAVALTHSDHPLDIDKTVLRAYAHLIRGFAARGFDWIVPNFCDVFGVVCMGLGARGFASGPSQSLRRLSLAGFRDEGGGIPLPHFYSNKVIAELLTETDLKQIVARQLVKRIEDRTPYSQSLMTELKKKGGSAANVPAWAESQNNLATSQQHFIARMATEEAQLGQLGPTERIERIDDWLEEASANQLYIRKKLGNVSLKGRAAASDDWLEVLRANSA
jgi:hypothetical protein